MRQRTRLMRIVSRHYNALMKKEFDTIEPHLPPRIRNVLDIGGGLGGVDVFLNRSQPEGPAFHLLDRNRVDPVMRYGYRDTTEAYNSFAVAQAYLTTAGIAPEQISFYDADVKEELEQLMALDVRFDLILSLKSWCFHYPVETYLALVRKLLARDGVLIVDVRRDRALEEKFKPGLQVSAVVAEDPQSRRLCIRRAPAPSAKAQQQRELRRVG